jgi:hypothetical protein
MPLAPCRKVVVDWIIICAFLYIKHIPNVHLAGKVKQCTKDKWYHILQVEHTARRVDQSSHGYDHAKELGDILGRPIHAYVPL